MYGFRTFLNFLSKIHNTAQRKVQKSSIQFAVHSTVQYNSIPYQCPHFFSSCWELHQTPGENDKWFACLLCPPHFPTVPSTLHTHIPALPYILYYCDLHFPTLPHACLHFPTFPYTSLNSPILPNISLHFPTTPYTSLQPCSIVKCSSQAKHICKCDICFGRKKNKKKT